MKMKLYRSIDKSPRAVEHILLHRQANHRLSSHAASLFALFRHSSFCR